MCLRSSRFAFDLGCSCRDFIWLEGWDWELEVEMPFSVFVVWILRFRF